MVLISNRGSPGNLILYPFPSLNDLGYGQGQPPCSRGSHFKAQLMLYILITLISTVPLCRGSITNYFKRVLFSVFDWIWFWMSRRVIIYELLSSIVIYLAMVVEACSYCRFLSFNCSQVPLSSVMYCICLIVAFLVSWIQFYDLWLIRDILYLDSLPIYRLFWSIVLVRYSFMFLLPDVGSWLENESIRKSQSNISWVEQTFLLYSLLGA